MATAILPQPARVLPTVEQEVFALAHEISDVEGVGLRAARVLAELYHDELSAYAAGWDAWAAAQQPRCPQCGATLEARQAYAGGRGYIFVEVCSGDASHYSKRV